MRTKFNAPRLIAVSAAALTALAATGLAIGASGSDGAQATWSWESELPGTTELGLPAKAQAGLRAVVAISPGIEGASVRRVASVGTARQRLTLVAAAGPEGMVCHTILMGGGGRQFDCLDANTADNAIVRYVADGGTTIGEVEWVTIIGIVRSDVVRVTLLTKSGAERELSLNRWRAFGFTTDARSEFPVALRAYRVDGSLAEESPTDP